MRTLFVKSHFVNHRFRAVMTAAVLGGPSVAICCPPSVAQQATKASAQTSEGPAKPAKTPKPKRWQVSWGVDADTIGMPAKPIPTTIARLLKYKRPKDLPGTGDIPERYKTHRIAGPETVVWSISGTVVNVAAEHDGDYRLIVADKRGNQVTCVLPDPALAPKRGRYSGQIDRARAVVVRKFHPTFTPRNVRVPVRLEGIGYFGKFNSDANKSPEGFQLHPVASVRFPAR